MTYTEMNKWIDENGTGSREHYYANGISYLFAEMIDGWIAIFEDLGYGNFVPRIQACDKAKAKDFCGLREPITVPVQVIA